MLVSILALSGCSKDKNDSPKDKPKVTTTAKPTHPETKPAHPETKPAAKPTSVKALAKLSPTAGNKAAGRVMLVEQPDHTVQLMVEMTGLTPGDHGFHIHEKGDCSSPDGKSAGGHFNPSKSDHGGPTAATHHAGDLGNLTANADGIAKATMRINFVTLGSGAANDAVGKAFIVHAKKDDMTSQPTGAAGARVACGIIESP